MYFISFTAPSTPSPCMGVPNKYASIKLQSPVLKVVLTTGVFKTGIIMLHLKLLNFEKVT